MHIHILVEFLFMRVMYSLTLKQAKMKSYRQSTKYKFGYRIPKDYKEALKLDEINQNTKLEDATITEMSQLKEYECFIDAGIYSRDKPPDGHKKICGHLVFEVKHDGRHKACYVAGGNLTNIPNESVYSGVVSLRGLRMVAFLSELNGLDLWATNIGNAYLEAKTMSSCLSLPVLNLEILRGICSLSTKRCMDYIPQVYAGVNASPHVFKTWASSLARLNQISG
jgi:hypothetical protein